MSRFEKEDFSAHSGAHGLITDEVALNLLLYGKLRQEHIVETLIGGMAIKFYKEARIKRHTKLNRIWLKKYFCYF